MCQDAKKIICQGLGKNQRFLNPEPQVYDDENGGFGLNNGQETPTGRPLSLSRVKAEVRLLRGLLYLHRNPGNKHIGGVRGIEPTDRPTRSSLNPSASA